MTKDYPTNHLYSSNLYKSKPTNFISKTIAFFTIKNPIIIGLLLLPYLAGNKLYSQVIFIADLKNSKQGNSHNKKTFFLGLQKHAFSGCFLFLMMFVFLFTNNIYSQIALRGTATTATSTNTNLTINKPTGVVAGDIMLVNIVQSDNDNNNLGNATLTGWTLVTGKEFGSNGGDSWWGTILYKVATNADVAVTNFTFTGDSAADDMEGGIIAFSGVAVTGGVLGGPFDVTPGTINNINTNNFNATAITTLTNNAAVIMFGMIGDNLTISNWSTTSPGTLTELFDVPFNADLDMGVGAAWRIKTTTGSTGTGSGTLSGTARHGSILIALRPCNSNPTITTTGTANAVCFSTSSQTTTLPYTATTNSPTSYSIDWNTTANTAGLGDQSPTAYTFVAGSGSMPNIAIPASLAAGTYNGILSIITTGGCRNTQAISVIINPTPTLTIVDPAAVCSPATVDITSNTVQTANTGTTTNYYTTLTLANAGGASDVSTPTAITTSNTYYIRSEFATGCFIVKPVVVTVYPLPTDPGNPTSDSPQCSFPGVTITRSGTVPTGETWYWQTTSNGTSTANSGATLNVTTSGTYYIRAKVTAGNCWSTNSGSITVVVNPLPADPGIPTSDSPQCVSTGVTLTQNGTAPAGETWYWQTSATGTSTADSSPTYYTTATGTYDIYVRSYNNTTGCWSIGTPASVTISPTATVGAVSIDQTICSGSSPSNITIASATGNIQWQRANDLGFTAGVVNIGSDATTLTSAQVGALTGTRYFRAIVTSGICTPITSGTVTVTVRDPFTAGSIEATNETICYNTVPTSTIGSTTPASGGDGAITYQWQYSTSATFASGVTTLAINTPTYTPTQTLTQTTYYRRLAKDGICNGFTSSTNTWTVTVRAQFSPGSINNSGGQTICYGGNPNNIGNATLASGGNTVITYSWRSSADGYTAAIAGATSSNYTPPNGLTITTSYRRYANDALCNTTPEVSNNTWTVTVRPQFTTGEISDNGETICYNTIPTATIGSTTAASGGNNAITYRWQYSTDINFAGATNVNNNTATYKPAQTLTQDTYYRRQAIDGNCNTTYTSSTNIWKVTVRPAFITGAIVNAGETICYGGTPTATIGSTTAASGGDGNITYRWQYSTNNTFPFGTTTIASSNTETYTPTQTLTQTTYYRRQVIDGTCNTTYTSSANYWTVTVRNQFTPGTIRSNGETICYGGNPSTIGIITSASGGNNAITYKWQANGVDIPNSNIASYNPPSGLTTTTTYTRYANDGLCNTTPELSSDTWTVTVRPQFTNGEISDTGETICYNTIPTATIGSTTAASGGNGAITYRWQYSTNPAFPFGTSTVINNTATYKPIQTLTQDTYYRRQARDGICNTFYNSSTNIWKVTVRPNNTVGIASSSPTLCINTILPNITHTTTGATGIGTTTGLPAGVTPSWSGDVITISGTPTASGAFNYSIGLTGGCGNINAIGTITVSPLSTMSLTSAVATDNQTTCRNTAITNITYNIGGSTTGVTLTGALPTGVTGGLIGTVYTISGTPTDLGNFSYTLTTTGGCLPDVVLAGTITVNEIPTIDLSSDPATTSQNICINTALTDITYTIGGSATGATLTGTLPTGVTGGYVSGIFTISGTPTEAGTFNYTVTTSGGLCPSVALSGTIIVKPLSTINLTSAVATDNQTTCRNTAIINIVYTIGGSATGVTLTGALPTGVTGGLSGTVYTISGTPTAIGNFSYTLTTTGGCLPDVVLGGIINVNEIPSITLSSAPATTSQSICINTKLTDITYTIGGIANNATLTGTLPSGVTGGFASGLFTISGTPTVAGTFSYTVTTSGGLCPDVALSGTIIVKPLTSSISLSSAAGTNNQNICKNSPLTNITYAIGGSASGVSVTGLPAGISGNYASGIYTISGTPTVSGTFNYNVSTIGGCSTGANAIGTIKIEVLPLITLTSSVASKNQNICINTSFESITYSIGGSATGATVSGLPLGINGSYSGGLFTISGTPTEAGTFNYTVTSSGSSPCADATSTGTIQVDALATVNLYSAAGTDNQTRCINTAITSITYSLSGGAFGATVSGLPNGLTGNVNGAGTLLTISGTPTVSGTFNYTVTKNGGSCADATTTGTIIVATIPVITLTSAVGTDDQAVCRNTSLTPIIYNIGGNATVATVTNLPTGLGYNFTGGILTISGTPTTAQTRTYTITISGGTCSNVTKTGTIKVDALPTITRSSALGTISQTLCMNIAITNITYNLTGSATGATVTGLPAGVTGSVAGTVLTISGTPTEVGNFTYTATTTGGACNGTTATGTIKVNPLPVINITSDYCTVPGKVQLVATSNIPGTTFVWSTGATTSTINIDIVGLYNVTGKAPAASGGCTSSSSINVAQELVINGSFTDGNTGFTSGYTYYPDVAGNTELVNDTGTNGYGVGTNGQNYHNDFWGIDHTNNSVGPRNFMLVNGHDNITIWQQTVNVQPHTDYYFSAWAMSLNDSSPYAKLQFEIDGSAVGTQLQLVAGPSNNAQANANNYWNRFYSTPSWNSGTRSGPITIKIINLVNAAGGNDFGLDDISFGTFIPFIKLTSPPASSAQTVCQNQAIDPITYSVGGGVDGPTVSGLPAGIISTYLNGLLTISGTPTVFGSFTYQLETTGCAPIIVNGTINVKPTPVQPVLGAVTQPTCASATGSFTITNYDSNYTYSATPSAGVSISGATVTAPVGTYTIKATSLPPTGGCTSVASAIATVNAQPFIPVQPILSSVTQPTCTVATGSFTITNYNATYTYSISPSTEVSRTGNKVTAPEGSYTITATSGICSSVPSESAIVNAQPITPDQPILGTVTQPTCTTSTGSFTITNYNASYTYVATPSAGVTFLGATVTAGVGDYTIKATSNLGCTSIASASASVITSFKIWNGSVSKDWNDSNNWTPSGIPTASQSVLIPSPTPNYPEITSSILCCRITIQNGANLNVTTNNTITVTNDINVLAGSQFLLEDSASLIQINDVPNTVTGTFSMTRITQPMYRYDYTYWGSPLTLTSNYTLGNLTPNTRSDKYYSWVPTIGNAGGNWKQESVATIMDPLKGYIARAPDNYPISPNPLTKQKYTATFTGTPNNGNISAEVSCGTLGNSPSTQDDKWNLLGNPYPSAIDANKFLNNNNNIEGNVSLWTHGTPILASNPNPFYGNFTYNYSENDMLIYNLSASVPAGFDGQIAAGQGFMVSMLASCSGQITSVNFTNSMRSTTNNNFHRSSNKNGAVEKNRIWFSMIDKNKTATSAMVGYIEGASNGNDRLYDALADLGTTMKIYSLLEDKPMTIQGRAIPFDANEIIPLGMKISTPGTYAIAIDQVDGLFDNQEIYLEDKLMNVIYDLKLKQYDFVSAVGTFNDRFFIRYTNNSLSVNNPTLSAISVIALINKDKINIQASENIKKIEVFDIAGKLIKIYIPKNSSQKFEDDFQFSDGIYLAKIKLESGVIESRKLANGEY